MTAHESTGRGVRSSPHDHEEANEKEDGKAADASATNAAASAAGDRAVEFSDTHGPTTRPDGSVIPQGVRDALLDWFQSRCGVTPTEIFDRLAIRPGYGSAVARGATLGGE